MTQRRDDELPAIAATYDLVLWFVPVLDRMPRSRKFTLGDRIETRLIEVLGLVVAASYSSDKVGLLREASLRLDETRYLVRLAKDLKAISFKSWEQAVRGIDELGRMLGGWMRQQQGRR